MQWQRCVKETDAETVFLTTSAEYMFLSSSLVRQVAGFGGDISEMVPRATIEKIKEKLFNKLKQ